jgi:hypothetical protein
MIFYKKSENTNRLIQTKLIKNLSYCDDDMIIEYIWNYGIQTNVIHYENGKVEVGIRKVYISNIQ